MPCGRGASSRLSIIYPKEFVLQIADRRHIAQRSTKRRETTHEDENIMASSHSSQGNWAPNCLKLHFLHSEREKGCSLALKLQEGQFKLQPPPSTIPFPEKKSLPHTMSSTGYIHKVYARHYSKWEKFRKEVWSLRDEKERNHQSLKEESIRHKKVIGWHFVFRTVV